jgi:hypothetical protein
MVPAALSRSTLVLVPMAGTPCTPRIPTSWRPRCWGPAGGRDAPDREIDGGAARRPRRMDHRSVVEVTRRLPPHHRAGRCG